MRIANKVLHALGATEVVYDPAKNDPTTEAEFRALEYKSPVPITWQQYQEKYESVSQTFGLRYLRGERDRRLQATDWLMTVDNTNTLANKDEWFAYRQALRDLPNNPPAFVWADGGNLDFSKMNMPVQPPIVRKSQ